MGSKGYSLSLTVYTYTRPLYSSVYCWWVNSQQLALVDFTKSAFVYIPFLLESFIQEKGKLMKMSSILSVIGGNCKKYRNY